ncbi:MAG: type II/IV secretion system protein [Parcubacteria group bacterium]|nr:type II/IV secretion system protein [Parcubacteria group bacterium]
MPASLTGEVLVDPTFLAGLEEKLKNADSVLDILSEAFEKGTSEVVRVLLGAALIMRASDIHIEPTEEHTQIRFRMDGLLHDIVLISPAQYQGLLSRIKLLSALKLNITNRAQDGRFTIAGEQLMEIRVSSLPSEYGESLVLRVLNPKNILSLQQLGLRADLLAIFRKEITKPNGMIVVTGPTGSGKTTTLYAFLREINHPEIKIITIEDPIEYHLEGISQTQVHPEKGYTFASGLRAIVRQDPDAILVGEIRDAETADIALQAALTGHLVLSTLHTNDAAGTITRLISLGAKPVNIAPALNLVVAQRLVRKVCEACASHTQISKEELALVKRELDHLGAGIKPEVGSTMKLARAKGCKKCANSGYKGRVGLFEAIVMDDELKELVLESPSITQLKKKAVERGMITLRQDGLLLVLRGVTTMEEIERVTAE